MGPVCWVIKAPAMMPMAENYFLTLGTVRISHALHKFSFVIVLDSLMCTSLWLPITRIELYST